MGELGAYSFDSSEYLTPQAVKDKKIRRVPKGSVLLSFKLTVGRVKIAAVDMTTNEAIAFFASNDPAKLAYLYPFLLTFDYGRLGSTSSIATAINSKTVKAMTITMPDDDTLARFYANVKPLYEMIMSNQRENAFLKSLRDDLLPRLMSGEIDVSKVDLTQLNSHLSEWLRCSCFLLSDRYTVRLIALPCALDMPCQVFRLCRLPILSSRFGFRPGRILLRCLSFGR